MSQGIFNRQNQLIEQYVRDVRYFSSQYGSDNSISYTVLNLVGKPQKYPLYGDFPETYTTKTYGKWWRKAPSAVKKIMPQCYEKNYDSNDFVEVTFEAPVFPHNINIYETYEPGSVVAIWAMCINGNWKKLWEGKPERKGEFSRIFSPPLRHCFIPTSIIRIEFDSSLNKSYPAIDAVSLIGFPVTAHLNLLSSNFHLVITPTLHNNLIEAFNSDTSALPSTKIDIMGCDSSISNQNYQEIMGAFGELPTETILKILKYLDLRSLCRCARINSYFYYLATDKLLYTELNFKLYWAFINSYALRVLQRRCIYLHKLDMSWCTSRVDEAEFINLLKNCGSTLTHLRLTSAKFVSDATLQCIRTTSPCIKELALGNCQISQQGFEALQALTKLEHLNLYRTSIQIPELVSIIQINGSNLRHLQLGGCHLIEGLDDVLHALGTHCPNLESLDLWKAGHLTPNGLRSLSSCQLLKELDLGWCLGTTMPEDSLRLLALKCPLLEKLFLCALRGVRDRDLELFADHCPKMRQMDLMGAPGITAGLISRFLTQFVHLELIDVSCCNQISMTHVELWRQLYPQVTIQMVYEIE